MKNLLVARALAVLLIFGSVCASAQEATGKLIVDIKAFSSEIVLKPKVTKQLESGGIEWGAKDGRVVFTMVNKRFVNFDMPQFTRYGTVTTIDLPAGEYTVVGVGLIPSTSFSPEKMLAKGAYFNEKAMTFNIVAGKETTLSIRPVIRKNGTFFINFFMPELLTTATSDGVTSPEVSLLAKNEQSIAWPAYTGDLKFKAP